MPACFKSASAKAKCCCGWNFFSSSSSETSSAPNNRDINFFLKINKKRLNYFCKNFPKFKKTTGRLYGLIFDEFRKKLTDRGRPRFFITGSSFFKQRSHWRVPLTILFKIQHEKKIQNIKILKLPTSASVSLFILLLACSTEKMSACCACCVNCEKQVSTTI